MTEAPQNLSGIYPRDLGVVCNMRGRESRTIRIGAASVSLWQLKVRGTSQWLSRRWPGHPKVRASDIRSQANGPSKLPDCRKDAPTQPPSSTPAHTATEPSSNNQRAAPRLYQDSTNRVMKPFRHARMLTRPGRL
jgi:hypothetical protein